MKIDVADMRNRTLMIGIFLLALLLMAVLLPSCGAKFELSSLTVSPAEIGVGGTTFVILKVQDTGPKAGAYVAVLKVNGQEVDRQQVALGAGGSQTITFALSENSAGSYQISVGTLNAVLSVVKNPVVPTPALPPVVAVPDEFKSTYANLTGALDLYNTYLNSQTGAKYPVTFGAELLTANSNRGPDLLQPQVLLAVKLYLDRLQELGVKGVTIPIHYPLYTSGFPRYSEYVAFYKQVEQEVRKRGLKLDVESHVIFANTPFSPIQFDFSSVTFAQYEAGRRQAIQSILTDLHPDFLNVGAEPDTEAKLSGFSELSDPQKYADYVNYLISGLNKGGTVIAAGIGTWGNVAYVRDFVTNKNLDCISLHIYPVVADTLQRTLQVINLAQQYHKQVILDEAWLYKVDSISGGSVATGSEVFKRDAYSFWSPLDRQFLTVIVNLARTKNIEYVSPFWSNIFFAYVDYNSSTANLSYADTVALLNQSVSTSLLNDQFSPAGDAYRQLIQANP